LWDLVASLAQRKEVKIEVERRGKVEGASCYPLGIWRAVIGET